MIDIGALSKDNLSILGCQPVESSIMSYLTDDVDAVDTVVEQGEHPAVQHQRVDQVALHGHGDGGDQLAVPVPQRLISLDYLFRNLIPFSGVKHICDNTLHATLDSMTLHFGCDSIRQLCMCVCDYFCFAFCILCRFSSSGGQLFWHSYVQQRGCLMALW